VNAVFLDTVGMLAAWDEADQWHLAANAAFEKLCADRLPVVTTSFVLLECGNSAARRAYRSTVIEWRDIMSANNGLITPSHDDWSKAWIAYERGDAGQAGLVDHISFAVMRRLGIQRAFTNDRHFTAAGFESLF
jgi:predicted nucleic acid-binding protein